MTHAHVPRPFDRRPPGAPPVLSEPEYLDRRALVKALGLGALALPALGLSAAACSPAWDGGDDGDGAPRSWKPDWKAPGGDELYPAERNTAYTVERPLCPEDVPARHNNFYEFLPGKAGPVHRYTDDFEVRPWEVEIAGLVEEPRSVDMDELARIAPLEERVYRFRCVEAWSMVVPWIGIPMAEFVRWCRPKPEARYVRFVSFHRPEQAPGQKSAAHYPWPYYEALRMDEALHPLALLVTGIYGHALPVQHGAPLRVVVPWKYGYKSAKSFVKVEFTKEQPKTFWNDLQPREYGFLSNVEPEVPHPRWSQASERDICTGDRIPTLPYNGYADEVAALYAKK